MSLSSGVFLSGLSLDHAKRDAKMLSKKHGIKLSDALDVLALRNFKRSWRHAHQNPVSTPLPRDEISKYRRRWLHAEFGIPPHFSISYDIVENTPARVLVKDRCDEVGGTSLTNGAELLLYELGIEQGLLFGKALHYIDKQGRLDEIRYDRHFRFAGFAPVRR